ncbi:MAG: hypothetical protein WDZ77_03355 [Candidatus Pacearchaeota archaeon]
MAKADVVKLSPFEYTIEDFNVNVEMDGEDLFEFLRKAASDISIAYGEGVSTDELGMEVSNFSEEMNQNFPARFRGDRMFLLKPRSSLWFKETYDQEDLDRLEFFLNRLRNSGINYDLTVGTTREIDGEYVTFPVQIYLNGKFNYDELPELKKEENSFLFYDNLIDKE